MSVSDTILKEFYQDIQEWIDDGCPKHKIFTPYGGLCVNLENWCIHYYQHYPKLFRNLGFREVGQYLTESFRAQGLNAKCPFNDGSIYEHLRECQSETLFKNKKRLEWVRKHAME